LDDPGNRSLRHAERFQDTDLARAFSDRRVHREQDHQHADRCGDADDDFEKDVERRDAGHVKLWKLARENDLIVGEAFLDAGRDFLLLRGIVASNQNRIAAILAADLILHRCERDLHPATAGWLINSNHFEGALVKLNRRSDAHVEFLRKRGIDNRLIALLHTATFLNRQVVQRDILIVRNAFDQARAESRIALVEMLPDGNRGTHAANLCHVGRMTDRNRERLAATETETAGRPHDYLRADISFAFAAFAQKAVR